jgi:EAL domain-containing protein (putative c-di-GMP-specific phosphodiesterase class I)
VNLSTTNLLDLDLVGTIERLLQTHGLPADALIIEFTESTPVDSVRSRNTVAALHRQSHAGSGSKQVSAGARDGLKEFLRQ